MRNLYESRSYYFRQTDNYGLEYVLPGDPVVDIKALSISPDGAYVAAVSQQHLSNKLIVWNTEIQDHGYMTIKDFGILESADLQFLHFSLDWQAGLNSPPSGRTVLPHVKFENVAAELDFRSVSEQFYCWRYVSTSAEKTV